MRIVTLLCLIITLTASCSSKKVKQEIKQEVAQSKSIQNESDLIAMERSLLSSSNSLNQEQKRRLRELFDKNFKELQSMQAEIDQTKAVLFKELINANGSKVKIRLLESQLLRLNRKKTRYSISAYREAKNIVGKDEVPLEKTLNMLDNRTIHEF